MVYQIVPSLRICFQLRFKLGHSHLPQTAEEAQWDKKIGRFPHLPRPLCQVQMGPISAVSYIRHGVGKTKLWQFQRQFVMERKRFTLTEAIFESKETFQTIWSHFQIAIWSHFQIAIWQLFHRRRQWWRWRQRPDCSSSSRNHFRRQTCQRIFSRPSHARTTR